MHVPLRRRDVRVPRQLLNRPQQLGNQLVRAEIFGHGLVTEHETMPQDIGNQIKVYLDDSANLGVANYDVTPAGAISHIQLR